MCIYSACFSIYSSSNIYIYIYIYAFFVQSSAFPDVDGYFGSLGSFFDLKITSGSYQANPPFTQPIMQRFCDRVETALRDPSVGPLSFTIIVPEWEREPAWNMLDQSEFCKRRCI